MIDAFPYTFEVGRPGYILNEDELRAASLNDRVGMADWDDSHNRYRHFGLADLNIVDIATFVAGFQNKFGKYTNYTSPSLVFVRHHTASDVYGCNADGSPAYYREGIYEDNSCLNVRLLLDLAGCAICPVADEDALRIYVIGKRRYTLYDGPDSGGYDVEQKLYIEDVDTDGLAVLSTIPQKKAVSWNDAYLERNASVYMVDGKLWIYPASGGLLVIDSLNYISGDIAPFSD